MKARNLETALEKVSRVITDRYGLRLICQGDSCRTNGKVIYLPSLPGEVPDDLLGAIRGWADHEVAHVVHTQAKAGPKFQKKHGRRAFDILNVLEDARVERLIGRRYPGARLNLEEGFRFVASRVDQRPLRDPFKQFASALYTRASGRPDQPWITSEAYDLVEQCQPELSELASCRNTRQVSRLAVRIWDKVRERLPEETEQSPNSQEPAHDQRTPSGAGGKGPQSSQPEPQEAPAEATPSPEPSGEEHDGFSPMGELGGLIEGAVREQCPGESGTYRAYTTEFDVVDVPELDKTFDYCGEMEVLRPHIAGLRRRLLQTLMGQRETRWIGDKARGRLDPRALHRLATGRSARIFRQHTLTDGGTTACTLLLDLSSSMSGTQIQLCRQLALIFAETLDKLSFPCEIIGFSTLDRDLRSEIAQETRVEIDELARRFSRFVPLYHAIFKTFEEPWRRAAGRLGSMTTMSLTPLGESLLFAGRRLALRPEKRKVLFCLTDGKPVVGAWNEQVTFDHACQAVKRLTAAGVETIGVGILEQCVAQIFPRHAIISHLQELPRGFIGQLCSVLAARG